MSWPSVGDGFNPFAAAFEAVLSGELIPHIDVNFQTRSDQPNGAIAGVSMGDADPNLGNVKAIQLHHLVPGRDKIVNELLLRIQTSINFCQCAELRI